MAKMAPLLAMLAWALLLLLPSYVLSLPLPSTDVRRGIPTALARRQGPKKSSGNKSNFEAGVGSLKFLVSGSSYPSRSTLFQDDQVQTGYGPLHMDRLDSFDFGTTPKSEIIKLQRTDNYHSEHILEFQVVKNLILSLTQEAKPSKGTATTWTPSATTRYRSPVDPATLDQGRRTPLDAFMKKAATELDFHSYLCLWWAPPRLPRGQPAQNKLEVGSIKHLPPFDIITRSLPNDDHFQNELVLLDGDTNGLKNAIWSKNINIRTVDKMTEYIKAGAKDGFDPTIAVKAFIAVKHTMLSWEYMTTPKIQSTYNTEAERIISAFDSIERQLVKLPFGAGSDFPYFKAGYQMLGLKEKSEDFLRNYAKTSYEKSMKFIKAWAPVIIATWSEDYRDVPLSMEQSLVPGKIKDWDLKQQGHSLAKLRDLFAAEIAAETEEDQEAKKSAADEWDSQSGGEGAQKSDSEVSEGDAPPVAPGILQTPGKPSTRPAKVPPAPQKPQGQAGRPGTVGELSPSRKTESGAAGTVVVDGFPKPGASTDQKTDATSTTGQKTDTSTGTDGKSGTGTDQSQNQGAGAGAGRPQRLTLNPKPVYAGASAAKDKDKDLRYKDVKHEYMKELANALFEHLYPQGQDTWFQSMERKWKAGPYYGGGGGSSSGGGGSQMVLPIRPGPSQQAPPPPGGAGATSQRQPGGSGSGSGRSGTTSGQAAPAPATGQPGTQPGGQTPTKTKAPAPKKDEKTKGASGSGTQKGGSSSATKGGKGGSGSGKKGGSS